MKRSVCFCLNIISLFLFLLQSQNGCGRPGQSEMVDESVDFLSRICTGSDTIRSREEQGNHPAVESGSRDRTDGGFAPPRKASISGGHQTRASQERLQEQRQDFPLLHGEGHHHRCIVIRCTYSPRGRDPLLAASCCLPALLGYSGNHVHCIFCHRSWLRPRVFLRIPTAERYCRDDHARLPLCSVLWLETLASTPSQKHQQYRSRRSLLPSQGESDAPGTTRSASRIWTWRWFFRVSGIWLQTTPGPSLQPLATHVSAPSIGLRLIHCRPRFLGSLSLPVHNFPRALGDLRALSRARVHLRLVRSYHHLPTPPREHHSLVRRRQVGFRARSALHHWPSLRPRPWDHSQYRHSPNASHVHQDTALPFGRGDQAFSPCFSWSCSWVWRADLAVVLENVQQVRQAEHHSWWHSDSCL